MSQRVVIDASLSPLLNQRLANSRSLRAISCFLGSLPLIGAAPLLFIVGTGALVIFRVAIQPDVRVVHDDQEVPGEEQEDCTEHP